MGTLSSIQVSAKINHILQTLMSYMLSTIGDYPKLKLNVYRDGPNRINFVNVKFLNISGFSFSPQIYLRFFRKQNLHLIEIHN